MILLSYAIVPESSLPQKKFLQCLQIFLLGFLNPFAILWSISSIFSPRAVEIPSVTFMLTFFIHSFMNIYNSTFCVPVIVLDTNDNSIACILAGREKQQT